ncbi:MAG TPA: FMN-binding protein [Acidimicrobiales bacterium]|nr:FMN-binding protein [Acidimicrobiales bacterium]
MRRALLATAGTVVGLAALLSYKSSGPANLQKVQLGSGQAGAAATTVPAATPTPSTSPSTGNASSAAPTTTSPPATTAGRQTYVGQDVQYVYGDIEVAATLQGGKILSVTVPQNEAIDGHSQMINSYAVPILEQEAVAAQGLNFNVVSGATFTSDAFAQSLQSALSKARK